MGMRKPKHEEKEEAKKEKPKEKKPEKKRKIIEGVRGIVRIAEIDLDGSKKVRNAILGIKGVGKSLANGIVTASGLDSEALLGSLTEEQIKKLEDAIKNPSKYGIPYHMLNRRSDPSTRENRHLVSSELKLSVKSDIDFMKKIRCYKGVRHELGLPVRGQRTRSSFRTGIIVGVTKGKLRPGAPVAHGAPTAKKEEAKPEAKPTGTPTPTKGAAPPTAKTAAPTKAEKKEEKK
jgi:small subunit ribosomal protein S13